MTDITYEEYKKLSKHEIATENEYLLKDMGWPDDPLNLNLINGKYRYPPPHNLYDVYVVGMNTTIFFEGPYNENIRKWGTYHSDFVKYKCNRYGFRRLDNIRVIHQYHRVWKDEESTA